ncbi:MAG: hypothetical protein NZ902_06380 [Acidilobaceae archaeon]|nr:hypothetical protein [Acidilobaceae archaeon]MCX8166164.1 hypothetical protein [Acidilobaceae archaeon]MDW7974802.1 RIO1 family regulatory kinase/ATPase [Sulfolobales archaeon]
MPHTARWSLFRALLERFAATLDAGDLRVLRALEALRESYEYVPLELLELKLKMPPSHLSRSLERLVEMRAVRRAEQGVSLTFRGLDALAFLHLKRRGYIARLGERIGAGKEGDVFLVELPEGELGVLKLHRGGVRRFRKMRRYRGYAAELRGDRLKLAVLTCRREHWALEQLSKRGALVPRPIARSRHALLQEYIEGVELYKLREAGEQEARELLLTALGTVRKAYLEVAIVHGDLSEYNVLASNGRSYVIDWPQYLRVGEPGAEEALRGDVERLVRFFSRRFSLDVKAEDALSYVRGIRGEL